MAQLKCKKKIGERKKTEADNLTKVDMPNYESFLKSLE